MGSPDSRSRLDQGCFPLIPPSIPCWSGRSQGTLALRCHPCVPWISQESNPSTRTRVARLMITSPVSPKSDPNHPESPAEDPRYTIHGQEWTYDLEMHRETALIISSSTFGSNFRAKNASECINFSKISMVKIIGCCNRLLCRSRHTQNRRLSHLTESR